MVWIVVGLVVLTGSVFGGAEAVESAGIVDKTVEKTDAVLKWYHSYSDGMEAARIGKHPVILSFHAEWCGWCKKMDRDVFADKEIGRKLTKYVRIKVDVDKDPSVAFAYGVNSLPRTIVINLHQEIVGDWLGYREKDSFTESLADVDEYLDKAIGAMKTPEVKAQEVGIPKPEEVKIDYKDTEGLIGMLGHRDAKVRTNVIDALSRKGDEIVAPMIVMLESKYLGERIGAWKVIRKMDIVKGEYDPWASAADRAQMVAMVKEELGKKEG